MFLFYSDSAVGERVSPNGDPGDAWQVLHHTEPADREWI